VAERQPKVLLVDDDPALIRMVRLTFITEGFDVVTAKDGIEGLERLEGDSVDLIVLDLQMPRMDGRTFYREMRSKGCSAPVVILSAFGAEEAVRELHAEAFVKKPFDPEDLLSTARGLAGPSDPEGGDQPSP
jgi:two-component system, OmpR family, response regulator MprA